MKKVQNKGFTMVELIFVLVILALIFLIVVATYPGIRHRMQLKSDFVSATSIANAIRGWYGDYSSDPELKEEFLAFIESSEINKRTIPIDSITTLADYMNIDAKPGSLMTPSEVSIENQKFFVGLLETGNGVRIVISVGLNGKDISGIAGDATFESIAIYNGYEDGIIYVDA